MSNVLHAVLPDSDRQLDRPEICPVKPNFKGIWESADPRWSEELCSDEELKPLGPADYWKVVVLRKMGSNCECRSKDVLVSLSSLSFTSALLPAATS